MDTYDSVIFNRNTFDVYTLGVVTDMDSTKVILVRVYW